MAMDFMAEAARLACAGVEKGDGGPFGAVIVRTGEVVARGWNRVLATQDPTAHAEVIAIREACRVLGRFHLEDCELYTTCEPCPMCLGAIYWARLRAVVYANTRDDAARIGFDDLAFYAEFAKPPAERKLRFTRLPHPLAERAFQAWAARPEKSGY